MRAAFLVAWVNTNNWDQAKLMRLHNTVLPVQLVIVFLNTPVTCCCLRPVIRASINLSEASLIRVRENMRAHQSAAGGLLLWDQTGSGSQRSRRRSSWQTYNRSEDMKRQKWSVRKSEELLEKNTFRILMGALVKKVLAAQTVKPP